MFKITTIIDINITITIINMDNKEIEIIKIEQSFRLDKKNSKTCIIINIIIQMEIHMNNQVKDLFLIQRVFQHLMKNEINKI